ncbi:MAG: hypothetical protein A2Y25_05135 [Candidatus Melainabacteria bacterium GWF2_37_15]|nr:MAG: hypothetical protein A2Y25_05135 [Candidatus Melainabacteria bacterium GWF2_37_15]
MKINELIDDLNSELSSSFDNFEGIYFYGSRVKGDFAPESDFDFIIMFKDNYSNEDEYKLAGVIIKIELKYDIFIDYHPMTKKELERNPIFYDQVANKGIYYEAA